MNIGQKIKETIELNNQIYKKIYNAFNKALQEAEDNGLKIVGESTKVNLRASIHGYDIDIPIEVVIEKLKYPMGKITEDISDQKIENVVNELIMKALSL